MHSVSSRSLSLEWNGRRNTPCATTAHSIHPLPECQSHEHGRRQRGLGGPQGRTEGNKTCDGRLFPYEIVAIASLRRGSDPAAPLLPADRCSPDMIYPIQKPFLWDIPRTFLQSGQKRIDPACQPGRLVLRLNGNNLVYDNVRLKVVPSTPLQEAFPVTS